MAKKRIEKPKREPTKRQLSRWQQERKRARIIRSVGIFIIVSVLCVVGWGLYSSYFKLRYETVVKVNDTEFNMNYYIKTLKLYGSGWQASQMIFLAEQVEKSIQRSELIRQGAMELGITVSKDAVDEELESNDPPLSKDYRDVVRTNLLAQKLLDEHFDELVPKTAEQRHIMAMLVESESQANELKARVEGGEDFAELATEYSWESVSRSQGGDLGWKPRDIVTQQLGTSVPEEVAFNAEVGVLSPPTYDEALRKNVGYWLIKVLERQEDPEQAHLEVMLLGSEEEARQIRDRLKAGEDIATLAEEYSQHVSSKMLGGDWDEVERDTMSPAVAEYVFDSDVGLETLSEPIRDDTMTTKGGYWLIEVIGEEDDREIEESDRNMLKSEAFNDWVQSLWDEGEVESYLNEAKKAYAVEQVTKESGL
ncbi:peptidylprolyl isomerase [Chloroflexota bacterium]